MARRSDPLRRERARDVRHRPSWGLSLDGQEAHAVNRWLRNTTRLVYLGLHINIRYSRLELYIGHFELAFLEDAGIYSLKRQQIDIEDCTIASEFRPCIHSFYFILGVPKLYKR